MSTDLSNNSLIVSWYSARSVFFSISLALVCTFMHNSKATATSRRKMALKYSLDVHRHTCSWRIIEMYQPPSMRLKFSKYSVMPWANSFNPLRSPNSTLQFCAGEPATFLKKSSMRRVVCGVIVGQGTTRRRTEGVASCHNLYSNLYETQHYVVFRT
jgi:hypothetical protein